MISCIIEKAKLIFRNLKYRPHFKKFGCDIKIYGKIICLGRNIEIGDHSRLNEGIIFNSRNKIIIGKHCHISHYAQVFTGELDLSQPYNHREHISRPIIIKDGVWICAGAIITPGVTIGEGSVIAAGSVVEDDVPSFELWGGVPARKLRDLTEK